MFVPGAGAVQVQGRAQGTLPIGVKLDGNAAETADVAADTAAFPGESSPIKKGQTGESRPRGRGRDGRPEVALRRNGRSEVAQAANGNMISVVATDSNQPPKKTEQVRKVQLPPQNPVRFTYDASGQPSVARRPTRTNRGRSERSASGGQAATSMLTYDNLWTYTWTRLRAALAAVTPWQDNENRLVVAESSTGVPPVNRLRLDFVPRLSTLAVLSLRSRSFGDSSCTRTQETVRKREMCRRNLEFHILVRHRRLGAAWRSKTRTGVARRRAWTGA